MGRINDIRSHSRLQKHPFPCGCNAHELSSNQEQLWVSAGKQFNSECMKIKETRALPKGLRSHTHTWLSAVSLSSLSWSKTASPGRQTHQRLLWRASQDGTSTGANMKPVNAYRRAGWWCFLRQPVPSPASQRAPPGTSCPAPRPELHPAGTGLKRLRCAARPAVRKNPFSSVYRTQEGKSLITEPSKTKMLKCLCRISAFVTFELMSVQSCVWFPPRSSGFVPAAPSLQLRHCFYGWTVGGQPSRRQTAPLRCSHCQIHQQILQLKYTITPKNRHSGPQLLQDYFQNAGQEIIFCLVDIHLKKKKNQW